MAHLESYVGAETIALTKDVLDRIDEIVPPGVDLLNEDRVYVPPSLLDASLRRRPSGLVDVAAIGCERSAADLLGDRASGDKPATTAR
jgi:hypothetical protein